VFTVFDNEGNMLATNQYFSVGGGFVVNNETQTANENMYYRDIKPSDATPSRRDYQNADTQQHKDKDKTVPAIADALSGDSSSRSSSVSSSEGGATPDVAHETKPHGGVPPYLFATAEELYTICKEHNLTIAQVVWENERAFRTDAEIEAGLTRLWDVMDSCIRTGVTSTEPRLPGGLEVRRRAPGLYRRLQQGFYPSVPVPHSGPSSSEGGTALESAGSQLPIGRADHPLKLVPRHTRPVFPGIEYLSCMAIAVNEVNASGGRVVTAPTNGAAGVIPATLKYATEFISTDVRRDTMTFLLTASAVGMLFKRGATISAAEGGCMAEVGVACSMAAAGLAAILGAEPSVILQAAEIGIEHNLGLTCDPLGGLVQVPCIERNSLGAVKAVTAAQLAMAGSGEHTVSLDEAIEACRTTAMDMHSHCGSHKSWNAG
jgi:L-serine deaminase